VARDLERRWEEALRQLRQIDEEFEHWQDSAPSGVSAEDREASRALAANLPPSGKRKRRPRLTGSGSVDLKDLIP
jgi:hypothetical protein